MDIAFELGQTVMTRNAFDVLHPKDVQECLERHVSGDWGELCDEDKEANDLAVQDGSRILSAYRSQDGTKFWIITEWDRSYTTILLPSDY